MKSTSKGMEMVNGATTERKIENKPKTSTWSRPEPKIIDDGKNEMI
jgi:hypothetical protein